MNTTWTKCNPYNLRRCCILFMHYTYYFNQTTYRLKQKNLFQFQEQNVASTKFNVNLKVENIDASNP